jgi:hypothetical protein
MPHGMRHHACIHYASKHHGLYAFVYVCMSHAQADTDTDTETYTATDTGTERHRHREGHTDSEDAGLRGVDDGGKT